MAPSRIPHGVLVRNHDNEQCHRNGCNKTRGTVLACGSCLDEKYCSVKCLKADWSEHEHNSCNGTLVTLAEDAGININKMKKRFGRHNWTTKGFYTCMHSNHHSDGKKNSWTSNKCVIKVDLHRMEVAMVYPEKCKECHDNRCSSIIYPVIDDIEEVLREMFEWVAAALQNQRPAPKEHKTTPNHLSHLCGFCNYGPKPLH